MTKHEIIELLSKDESCLILCKSAIKTDAHKDLYQYVFLTLLEIDEEKIIDIHKRVGIINYAKGVIHKSVYGNRSKFWNEYTGNLSEVDPWSVLKNVEEEEHHSGVNETLNRFDEELQKECNRCIQDGIYPAAVKIYEIYEKIGSYTEVSKCTQIPYKTIQRYVHGTREKILSNLNDKNTNGNAAE